MSRMKTKIYFIIFSMLLLSSILIAQNGDEDWSVEQISLNITVVGVEDIISVTTPLNFSKVLPFYEYESYLNVSWIAPEESLEGLVNTDEVLLFVEVSTANTTPYLYFKRGATPSLNDWFILRCKIVEGACGNESILEQMVPFYIRVDKKISGLSELITIRTSPVPPSSFGEDMEEASSINETIAQLREQIGNKSLNLSDPNVMKLLETLDMIEKEIADFDIENAQEKLKTAIASFEDITKQQSLFQILSGIEEEFKKIIPAELPEEAKPIYNEVATLLSRAREAAQNMDFETATELIELARTKLSLLNSMISESQMDLIGGLFGSGNWIYSIALGIAVLILIFLIAMRIRKREKKSFGIFAFFLTFTHLIGKESIIGKAGYLVLVLAGIVILLFLVNIAVKRSHVLGYTEKKGKRGSKERRKGDKKRKSQRQRRKSKRKSKRNKKR